MNDDPQLRREDFADCFAGEPASPSAAGDVVRGRDLLRRRRRTAGGVVAGIVAIVVLAVPLLTSLTFAPAPIDPAVPTTVRPTAPTPGPTQSSAVPGTCTNQMIKIADAITDPAKRPLADLKPVPDKDKDGKDVLMITVGATGEVLLEEGRNDTSENDVTTLRPGRLVLWDPATGKRTTIRGEDDLHQGTQTSYAEVDRDYVVWLEDPDTHIGTSTWKIYVFDRRTGKISKVASSPENPGSLPPDPQPRLYNGSLYWQVRRNPEEQGPPKVVDIYTRKLDLREPARRLVANAAQPVPTDGWLYYEKYDFDQYEDAGSPQHYAVYRTSYDGRTTELVHEADRRDAFSLSAVGEYSAWSEGTDLLVYRGATLVARLVPPRGRETSEVTMGDGMIGFVSATPGGDSASNYLLDLRTGCSLHRLSDAHDGGVVIATGRTVVWSGLGPDNSRYTWTVGRLR